MLAISRALSAEPKDIGPDESSLGLAPQLIDQTGDIITAINTQGTLVAPPVEQDIAISLGSCPVRRGARGTAGTRGGQDLRGAR